MQLICLLGFVASDNTTIDHSITEDVSDIANSGNDLDADVVDQSLTWGESSSWSKWSACSRSCDGGISRQQRRCRRKPCKGRSTRYKLCNLEPCEKRSDFRAEQCAAFDDVPYSGQLLKWYPHYDPSRPCALICRGEQSLENPVNRLQQETSDEKTLLREPNDSLQFDREETIVVQLADKVEDGTKCNRIDALGVCIDGECMKFGCDLRVGSNKVYDACGVCGGNGSSCQTRYSWRLEAISACSKFCGGGVQLAMAVCKTIGSVESVVDDSYCDPNGRPEKTMMPCNGHSCSAKWVTGEWSKCSASCGGGSRTRAVFCTEENGNETTKLPDHKCSGTHKPRYQETCNTISCPMWETNKWSECSVTCGNGIRRRAIECRDGHENISSDCDPMERPHIEQECKTNIDCPMFTKCYLDGEDLAQPLMQPYPPPPMPEKLIDQPIPSESTFIAEEWSPCSVTCGEGIRHREVYCKIFLDFSRTIAMLPDTQCSGPKPVETEKCTMEPCGLVGNSLSYRIDTVGDSGYVESSLTDTYRSPSGSSGGSGYEGGIKVASGSVVQTSYSWKEAGYTPCSTTCLGGVQDLIINCVRDDTGKTVTPLLCSVETKPEARIRVCNDHPCPPRWNYSDFSPCTSPCGIGVQTRDVICIHEVTRGTGKTVPVPSHMCPKPPPVDRRYCNVWDCPIKWSTGEWGKCSKTCGGGVKKRKVTCAQIMAQGRTQNREDRECPSQKPPTEKPCNTRSCHDMDANVQPIILSQNTTFNQTDFNGKVDLKIGGLAKVFQGTQYIKIRCPVKKFDKAQIVWKKDHKEIRKSRKYKITRKGALKIIDITSSDSGVYSCVAGQSHAETRLIVKFRSKEQISSEEYMRLGNSVHLQRNVNLDSAPANSGESLYTDRTAAYGNRFAPIDSEDLSHERAVPTGAKTTRRPHQKKQKTSPTPPDSTMMHKEQTVTSLNQPGYHESVESTVPSSASTLMPHISYLISSLKAYWPFHSDVNSKNHRTASVSFIDDVRKETIATKHTVPDRKTGLRYQNVEDNLESFYRNTAIPDKTFGPDEERIFIDVDPYDLDDSIFDPLHTETIKFSSIHPENEEKRATPADIDYVEESLKNVKRQWQDTRNFLRNERDNTEAREHEGEERDTTLDSVETELRFIPDSSTKGVIQKSGNTPSEGNGKSMNRESYENQDPTNSYVAVLKNLEQTTELSDSEDEETLELMNKTDGYAEAFEEDFKKRTVDTYKENDTAESGIGRSLTTKNLENKEKEDATVTEDRGEMEKYPPEKNVSREFSREHQENSKGESGESLKSRPLKTDKSIDRLILSGTNVTNNSTIGSLTALDGDDLLFEWVTTDWSKCSQTCGGSGFQMRGAQCTVRSGKPIGNSSRISTRTVIGATLCEDAGHPVPQKVRSCGSGRCPQWHTTEWTTCETSRCFNWKTAMQRRDITCRLVEDLGNGEQNITLLDPNKCDDATRPLQRQECYNDACKGVWRVGEWSECTASCEEDGIKYRILQCVWYGTKKPAGNACRDIPRPPVMKTCRGPPCPQSPEECKDHSQLCSRVKMMNMCKVPLYQKQCCESCR